MRNKKAFTTIVSLLSCLVMMFCVSFAATAVNDSDSASKQQNISSVQIQKLSGGDEDDLPMVDDSEIVEPTEFQIPDVPEVSLINGVVSWLCVAVGIAVLAGVLVSQRTKQVQKPDNRRR